MSARKVKVKICGITSLVDALAAVEAGADALGFVFFDQSPRQILPEVAARIVEELPPFVSKVGVFVDSPFDVVRRVISRCHLDLAQLHGRESPGFCQALSPRVVKAFRVQGRTAVDRIRDYSVAAYLLDAYNPSLVGGTGETFDWQIAGEVSATRRVILAGGLTVTNVPTAISVVKPYGVDVSTGVEIGPGRKDVELMRAFIQAAKGVTLDR